MQEVKIVWCLKRILFLSLIFFTQNVTSQNDMWGKNESYFNFKETSDNFNFITSIMAFFFYFYFISEYAISTDEQILLYNSNWTLLKLSIKKEHAVSIKTITYDPVCDVLYFADRNRTQPRIYSLKFKDNGKSFIIDKFYDNKEIRHIEDLVYDPFGKTLYWSSSTNQNIMKLPIIQTGCKNTMPGRDDVFLDFSEEVYGLEIDVCTRKLYFTTAGDKSSVNVVNLPANPLDKPIPRSFIYRNHTKLVALTLDRPNQKIYVADVKRYRHYSIDSYNLDGSGFRNEIKNGQQKLPRSITVDNNFVYYVDGDQSSVNRFSKNKTGRKTSESIQNLKNGPFDIIVRSNFIDKKEKCIVSVKKPVNQNPTKSKAIKKTKGV